jgi:hypothetical protein
MILLRNFLDFYKKSFKKTLNKFITKKWILLKKKTIWDFF